MCVTTQIFTLTTDFGLKDPYVAEMKAAILCLYPAAQIIDITHDVNKYDIRAGAYVLASAASYFPTGTIHIAVVDPGVGSQRRPLIIQTEQGFFVGPDNGLLILAAKKQGVKEVRDITSRHLMLHQVSSTFHGRDVFAPAAAHLASGVRLEEFGPVVEDVVEPAFAKVTKSENRVDGEVLYVDDFGNVITNIDERNLDYSKGVIIQIELPHSKLQLKFSKTYADVKPQQPLLLIGSQGYLEIAVNQGNAANQLQAKPGDKISLTHT
jgi:S-adenosyl-L-methionine hydrolase (adenosine-forming)